MPEPLFSKVNNLSPSFSKITIQINWLKLRTIKPTQPREFELYVVFKYLCVIIWNKWTYLRKADFAESTNEYYKKYFFHISKTDNRFQCLYPKIVFSFLEMKNLFCQMSNVLLLDKMDRESERLHLHG